MRTVQFLVNHEKQGEYQTFHEALFANRIPPRGGLLICNGEVLATAMATVWELRSSGVSALAEEFHSPLFK